MEDNNDEENEKLSPMAEHIRNELRKVRNRTSDGTSILDYNDYEAQTRAHFDDNLDYLGTGPSCRNLVPHDDDPFFKQKEEGDRELAPHDDDPFLKWKEDLDGKLAQREPSSTAPTFTYKMLLGYSNPTQIDHLKKALHRSSTVLREGTGKPSRDLAKLLKWLWEAHPPAAKRKNVTYEERKSDAIVDMVAANHPCLVYKMKIKCRDVDQEKKLEEALLHTSVILFSCVSPSHEKAEASKPSVKMQVRQRIRNIFNFGSLN